MRVLISGAGIAGLTLAYWLRQYGYTVTVVEKAPTLRAGGYVIDFWGLGYEIAERMGLLPQMREAGYAVQSVTELDAQGRPIASLSANLFQAAADGRYISIPRGNLVDVLFAAAKRDADYRFGVTITALENAVDAVDVTFSDGRRERYDLVFGADGLHSNVRRLAFGDETQFERYLGYKVAAFDAAGYPKRDELRYIMHTSVGRQLARFSLRDGRTLFFFVFVDDDTEAIPHDLEERKELVRRHYADIGWEAPAILEMLDRADEVYLDRVSQIYIPSSTHWSRGRIALVGDAAYCVSFLAGEGSSLAMSGAYTLACELARTPHDHEAAFARYESRLRPAIDKKQKSARRFGVAFAPQSRLTLWLRNFFFGLFKFRVVTHWIGKSLVDPFDLPEPVTTRGEG